MQIRLIRDIEEVKAFADEWNEILKLNNNTNPYITPEWIRCWWKFYGAKRDLYIITFFQDNQLIGICPLMTYKRRLHKEFKSIGHPQCTRSGFVVRNGYEDEFTRNLLEHLLSIRGSGIFRLIGINREHPCCNILKERLKGRLYFINSIKSYLINFKSIGFDEYFKERRKHNSVRTVISRERALRSVCTLELKRATEEEIDLIFPLHQKRWEKKNDGNGFGKGVSKRFFTFLAKLKEQTCWNVQVYLLMAGQIPIAFVYNIVCNGRVCGYRLAHDDDFAIFKPGSIIVKNTIENYFSSDVDVIDFSTGEEHYKKSWTDEFENYDSFTFGTDKLLAKGMILLDSIKYRIRQNLKKSKRLESFKRVTIGKIKYFLSGAPALELYKNFSMSIYKNKSIIRGIVGNRMRMYRVNSSAHLSKSDYEISEHTYSLDELPLLKKLLDLEPETIVYRYFKGSRCKSISVNNKIFGTVWISETEILIKKNVIWKAERKGDCCYYDFTVIEDKKIENMRTIINFLSNQFYSHSKFKMYLLLNNYDCRMEYMDDGLLTKL